LAFPVSRGTKKKAVLGASGIFFLLVPPLSFCVSF
jgi:hypothetical protein